MRINPQFWQTKFSFFMDQIISLLTSTTSAMIKNKFHRVFANIIILAWSKYIERAAEIAA